MCIYQCELGQPTAHVIDQPGDRQREQAAPGQGQEEHQEHVGVGVISHYGLDYVCVIRLIFVGCIRLKYVENTTKIL